MLSDLPPIRDFRTLHADEPLNCQILQDALYSAHLNGSATLSVIYRSDPVSSWGSRTVLLRAGGVILRKVCTESGAWTGHYKPLRFQVVARDIFCNIGGDDFRINQMEDGNRAYDFRNASGNDACAPALTPDDYFVISDCDGFRAEHAVQREAADSRDDSKPFHETLGFPVPPCVPLGFSRQGKPRAKTQFVEQRLACVFQRKDQRDLYDKWSVGGPDRLPEFLFLLTEYSRRPQLTPILVALGFVHPMALPEVPKESSSTEEMPFESQQSIHPHQHNVSSQRLATHWSLPLSIALAGLLNVVITALGAISRILRLLSKNDPSHRRPLPRRADQTQNVT